MEFLWDPNWYRCVKLIWSQIANGYLSRITGPTVKIHLTNLIFTRRTVARWNLLQFHFPIALFFPVFLDFLPKFSRLALRPYFSIPHFLSYIFVLPCLSQWWLWRLSSSGTFRHYALFWKRWIHSTLAILFVWHKIQYCLPLYAQIFKQVTALSIF